MSSLRWCLLLLGIVLGATYQGLGATPADPDPPSSQRVAAEADSPSLSSLSLEELLEVPVVSAAKKATSLGRTAAAAYVITADDIRRFGFQSVPEALRLVPGVNVARIDGSRWAVSVRGFNNRFANKLLVLVDGRPVYTPLFSGVIWEMIGVVMEDIERIEVIRGPGSTTWGANAMNGVINIITKNASRTAGGLAVAEGGDFSRARGVLRYGSGVGKDGWIRASAVYNAGNEAVVLKEPAGDDENWLAAVALRLDLVPSDRDEVSVQATVADGVAEQSDEVFTGITAPYKEARKFDNRSRHQAVIGRWQRVTGPASDLGLQVFWDQEKAEYFDSESSIRRFDFDFHHRLRLSRHDLVWGAGARLTDARFVDSFTIGFRNDEIDDWIVNGFVQDDISIIPDRFGILAGAKVEHASRADTELQPNLRLIWTPRTTHTLWASVARATRSPSYAEHDISWTQEVIPAGVISPTSPAAIVRYLGDRAAEREAVITWELGYRLLPHANLAIDAAAFWNDYENLGITEPHAPHLADLDGIPYLEMPFVAANGLATRTWGGEIAVDAQPLPHWRLRAAWSLLRWQSDLTSDVIGATPLLSDNSSPRNQAHALVSVDLTAALAIDAAWRHVGEIAFSDVPAYNEADARLRWRARPDLEFALSGRGLLHPRHQEYSPSINIEGTDSAIPRNATFTVRWDF